MKKFCCSLREHVTNVINSKRKKMFPLTKKAKITKGLLKIKIIAKFEIIAILQINTEVKHIVYAI